MKNLPYMAVCAFFVTAVACTPGAVVVHESTYAQNPGQPAQTQQQPQYQGEENYQVFYDQLSPYGRWINYPEYGYVWAPSVDVDFQPYSTNGHWVYSDEGWTWASDYQWGWAAFHYGRWFYEDGYGWLWMPGHQWSPAWVTWGHSEGYYGWAPLGPNVQAGDNWTPPTHSWTFVPKEHMTKTNVHDYAVNKTNNVTIVKNVTIINNTTNINNNNSKTVVNNNSNNTTVVNNNNRTQNNNTTVNNNNRTTNNNTVVNNNVKVNGNNNVVYNKGPQVSEVENVTKTKVQAVTISENKKPAKTMVSNNSLVMYRPVFKPTAPVQSNAAPKRVETYNKAAVRPQQPPQQQAPQRPNNN